MKLQHGGLVLEVPGDWTDRSTLLLCAPEKDAAGEASREVVSVSFHPGDLRPAIVLRQQTAQLRAVDPGLTVTSEGPFTCGLGEGLQLIVSMKIQGQPVRQLLVACAAGDTVVLASAASSPGRFPAQLDQLTRILRSMDRAEVQKP